MFHLAQANIAQTVASFSDPAMASMVSRVNEINALAEASPGFVWRYKNPEGWNWIQPFSDYFSSFEPEKIFFNMSVWKTPEDLRHYVFDTKHIEVLRSKHQWMSPPEKPHLVMWWIPVGCSPSVEEVRRRFSFLEMRGTTSDAFTFKQIFPPPAQT
jgi:hypothetical protein